MKLQDLASVRSGLVLSRKQAKEPSEYRYPLINLRCIQQEGTIQLKEADIYEAKEPLKEEYLSQSGDIIVRLILMSIRSWGQRSPWWVRLNGTRRMVSGTTGWETHRL